MKKLLSLIAIATLGLTTAFAQTAATATQVKQTAKKEVKTTVAPAKAAVKAEAKKVETKTTAAATTVKTTAAATTVKTTTAATAAKADAKVAKVNAAGVKLKADGTPDKRYKAVSKVVGPTKKDGTADMRYKANKEAAKKN